jgi:hypothetical protein
MTAASPPKQRKPSPLKLSLAALFLLFIIAVVWKLAFPSEAIRYRLTLEAEVDGKLVTASSVVEVLFVGPSFLDSWDPLQDDPRGPHTDIRVRGEAVALKLGNRGHLFATLAPVERSRSDGYLNYPCCIYAQAIVPRAWREQQIRVAADFARLRRLSPKMELSFDELPLLVRFGDLSHPETVERVDPNDLAASFGPGVRLVSATVELADAPITDKIDRILPWLANEKFGSYLMPGNGPVFHKLPPEETLYFDDLKRP